jgi:hypothetical protein
MNDEVQIQNGRIWGCTRSRILLETTTLSGMTDTDTQR